MRQGPWQHYNKKDEEDKGDKKEEKKEEGKEESKEESKEEKKEDSKDDGDNSANKEDLVKPKEEEKKDGEPAAALVQKSSENIPLADKIETSTFDLDMKEQGQIEKVKAPEPSKKAEKPKQEEVIPDVDIYSLANKISNVGLIDSTPGDDEKKKKEPVVKDI